MKITNHDDAERTCFTCSNAFVNDDTDCVDLFCVIKVKFVEDDDSCDDWN